MDATRDIAIALLVVAGEVVPPLVAQILWNRRHAWPNPCPFCCGHGRFHHQDCEYWLEGGTWQR